ncbi:MAG TPA: GNAT family N-acetyltransferase [Bacteroidia bacterium]|nr:GNAT family N-acetyltransferase [Bacteroidia bacterium]
MLQINFTPFPVLTTDRLILRQLKTTDEKEVLAIRSNETVNKYIDRPPTRSVKDARKFIDMITKNISNNESAFWAITLKNNPALIGSITLWKISIEHERAEIGYELLPRFHGKGIMQEALTKVVEFGFQTMQLKTIVAFTNKDNEPSKKLLERNNFRIDESMEEEKTEKEKLTTVVYSLRVIGQ